MLYGINGLPEKVAATPRLIAVMGPTASGKTEVAEALACLLNAQLINADAFQVYRGMDVGTAKPTAKHLYRLLDLKTPNETYGAGEFVVLARAELANLFDQGKSAVVVGGTGLYIRALFEQYGQLGASPDPAVRAALMQRERTDGLAALALELGRRAPDVAAQIDLRNPVRVRRALERLDCAAPNLSSELPPFRQLKLVIHFDTGELNARIESRAQAMVQNGWLEEVVSLKRAGFGPGDPGFRALGYAAMWQHVSGTKALSDALAATVTDTRRYAKRQRSWLRSEPNTVAIFGESAPELIKCAIGTLLS
ncbi:MAG: tRNA (adenosine(37)-N6)-dimethylallyltransferase MiaA [Fimbriimonadaceae bacterium]